MKHFTASYGQILMFILLVSLFFLYFIMFEGRACSRSPGRSGASFRLPRSS